MSLYDHINFLTSIEYRRKHLQMIVMYKGNIITVLSSLKEYMLFFEQYSSIAKEEILLRSVWKHIFTIHNLSGLVNVT